MTPRPARRGQPWIGEWHLDETGNETRRRAESARWALFAAALAWLLRDPHAEAPRIAREVGRFSSLRVMSRQAVDPYRTRSVTPRAEPFSELES